MTAKKDAIKNYGASSIQVLDQRTHLLKRISLTMGEEVGDKENPFSSQKTVAIREIIDNSIDEVIAGHADRVKVSFFKDGSVQIEDNGRGIPVDTTADADGSPISGIVAALGRIQSGGKFTTDSNRFSNGLNGVGSSSSVALALRADITVYRDNRVHKLSFKDFKPGFFEAEGLPGGKFTELTDLTKLDIQKDTRTKAEKKDFPTGTTVRIWLDDNLFGSKYPVNRLDLLDRLRGTAFLIPKTHIEYFNEIDLVKDLQDNDVPIEEKFYFEGGIPELLELSKSRDSINEAILIETTGYYKENAPVLQADGKGVQLQDIERHTPIEVAFSWDPGFEYHMESYVNTIRTRLGGIHEDAFEKALVRAFNPKIRSMRGMLPAGMPDPIIDDYKEGLSVIISVKVSEPQFTGQSKEKLGGREVRLAMLKAIESELEDFANASKNFETMRTIGKKVSDATKARLAKREAVDLKRQKAALSSSTDLPEKLVDCEITHNENSELYIAEGDSAKDALKTARHAMYQAILPIRGKIVNANKETMAKVLANKEVQDIIKCLDAGVGDDFDLDKLRYSRVFIAADADSDGGAIGALVLMLFWTLFRPMVMDGRLYQLQTPLFVVTPKNTRYEKKYAQDEEELRKIQKEFNDLNITYNITRIKGLGEADKFVLNETGMNPNTRIVKRIVADDIIQAQKMLDIALGKDVQPRKEWIEANPYDLAQATE